MCFSSSLAEAYVSTGMLILCYGMAADVDDFDYAAFYIMHTVDHLLWNKLILEGQGLAPCTDKPLHPNKVRSMEFTKMFSNYVPYDLGMVSEQGKRRAAE